jgi:Ni/Co efflux regulator RcnB
MTKYFVAALAIAFVAASSAAPGIAQTGDKAENQEKKLSTQQQKMKDCGAKWKEGKAAKNMNGREAYRKFISACLKGRPSCRS